MDLYNNITEDIRLIKKTEQEINSLVAFTERINHKNLKMVVGDPYNGHYDEFPLSCVVKEAIHMGIFEKLKELETTREILVNEFEDKYSMNCK